MCHVIIYFNKTKEYTIPRVNHNRNYKIWVIMIVNVGSLIVTIVPHEVGGMLIMAMNVSRQGAYGKSLYLFFHFSVTLKLLFKKKSS